MDQFERILSPIDTPDEKLGLFHTVSDGDRNFLSRGLVSPKCFNPKFIAEITVKNSPNNQDEQEKPLTPINNSLASPMTSFWHRGPPLGKDSQNDLNEI